MNNVQMRTQEEAFTPKGSGPYSALSFVVRPDGHPGFAVFGSPDSTFETYVLHSVLNRIDIELVGAIPVETIGLLAGRVLRDSKGPYTLVLASEDARGNETEATTAHVRISGSGHAKLRRRLQLSAHGLDLVGWYHSHPRFPASFSSVDRAEQSTLKDPYHLGIVVSGIDNLRPYGVYQGPNAIELTPKTIIRRPIAVPDLSAPSIEVSEAASGNSPSGQIASPGLPLASQNKSVASSDLVTFFDQPLVHSIQRMIVAGAYVLTLAFCLWNSYRIKSTERRLDNHIESKLNHTVNELSGKSTDEFSVPPQNTATQATDLRANPKLSVAKPSANPKSNSKATRTRRSARKTKRTGSSGSGGGGSIRRESRLAETTATSRSTRRFPTNSLRH